MDTLVYSASTFIIPINVAAMNNKYILMNMYILLTLASWAHHAVTHELSCLRRTECITRYNVIDVTMCYVAITYGLVYSVFFVPRLYFLIHCVCTLSAMYNCIRVQGNKYYYERGIKNWKRHTHHVLMHVSACAGFTVLSLA